MRANPLLLLTCIATALACGGEKTNNTSNAPGSSTGTQATGQASCPPPAPTPDDWHTCDSLFAVMGGVQGKLVADLFVGDGYYTMKLLEAGARVIAMDDDPRNIAAMEARKKELGICDERLTIRSCTPGAPNLTVEEVDMALCTRPYISLPDPTNYFIKVKNSVKFPNPVFIVEFLPEQSPVGPPMEQRMSEERMMDALEPCGFTDVGSYSKKLPYRYLVHALTFTGSPEDVVAGNEPPPPQ